MRYSLIGLAALVISVAACAPVSPVVSDYNGASVKIQRSTLTSDTEEEAKAKTLAEATRICQSGGKRRAEPASTRNLPGDNYTAEDLFLCLDR